jgi:2-dehydro-3-deoxyglucarate aldolase/4-hydroxy-2-oxoheptanedioate aldolase
MLVEIRQPSIMQILANAGFEFVIIDAEHGPFSIESIADASRAARSAGVTPIVRVPEVTYSWVAQPLDGGAQGIMVPRVVEAQQVRDAVQMMKYPPAGRRGSVLSRGHTDFKSGAVAEAMDTANHESMLVVQVETKPALEHLDEILSVPGLDAALIGPNDLSVALGIPGMLDDPRLVSAIETTIGACRRHAVIPAIHMNDLALGVGWVQRGMRMISLSSETGMIAAAGSEAVKKLHQAFGA